MLKKCKECGEEFSTNRRNKIFCSRKCNSKYHRRQHESEISQRYFSRLDKFLNHLLNIKGYDREELDLSYLLDLYNNQKGLCAISGVPLTNIRGSGRIPTNISIDRIDNNFGYTKKNVQLVCSIVNKMKSEYTEEQLLWWCSKILEKAGKK